LNKTLKTIDLAALSSPIDGLNRKLDGIQKQLQIGPALDAHLQHIVSPHSAASKFIGCKDCREGLNSFNVFFLTRAKSREFSVTSVAQSRTASDAMLWVPA